MVLPGTYYDCASWRTDRLTVEGRAADGQRPVFSDLACDGKASFVVGGSGTVLRNIGFTHMRILEGLQTYLQLAGCVAKLCKLNMKPSLFVVPKS